MRILIVDDQPRVASLIAMGLQASGYQTLVAHDGEGGKRLAIDGQADLMILDVMMPGKDGLTTLREVRERAPYLPVIVLTVKDDLETKVACLDAGANDYIRKPFSFVELTARIRAQLRERAAPTPYVLELRDLSLDLKTHEAVRGKDRVLLTTTEFRMLEMFMRHPRQVLSRSQILNHVWSYDFDPESNLVDVYVGYLRRKLNLDHGQPYLQTVRGSGYRLTFDDNAE